MNAAIRPRRGIRLRARLENERTAVAVMLALLFMAPVLYGVWWTAPPSTGEQPRMPPSTSPFPAFPVGPVLHVVRVGPLMNESARLELLSLQGLVNRERVELYLDFTNETTDPSSMLSFLRARYGLATDSLSPEAAVALYLPRVEGLVVYDPTRPESVNIATVLAGIRNAAILGPDLAANRSAWFSRPILLDYARSDWARLDAIGAYDRALAELYPSTNPNLLAILPPEKDVLRDYLIATRTFVFYDNQAMLATPGEIASTARILHATPRGIPILGWIRTPTLTEENAFVQMASAEGKYLVGGQDVPNLSVLTSIGRSSVFSQPPAGPPPLSMDERVYAVVAIADGDNLDFAAGRMRELWNEPTRGSYPVAWSLNSLFTEFAPPYAEYYYGAATPNDRFVAGPSGAGYLYPDYLGSGDLDPYLEFAGRYMQRADMDTVWLLNAFTASEIQYTSASLSAYVDRLLPRGIILDYDDQPTSASHWMQAESGAVAPVIRSTQLWTTRENLLAKVSAALDAQGSRPYFLWMTVYPWRFSLADAKAVLDEISARVGGRLAIVTPEQLFDLMIQDFLAQARRDLTDMKADPIANTLLGGLIASAEAHITEAGSLEGLGSMRAAANEAYLGSSILRDAALWEALIVTAAGAAILTAAAIFLLSRKGGGGMKKALRIPEALTGGAVVALLQVDLWTVLASNFWTYGYVLLGAASVLFAGPLERYITGRYPRRALGVSVLLFVLASGLTAVTGAGFPLAALMAATSLRSHLGGQRISTRHFLGTFLAGTAAGLLAPLNPWSIAAFGGLAVAAAVSPPPTPGSARPGGRSRGARGGAFLSIMPLVALTPFLSYSVALRTEIEGESLRILAIAVLAACPAFALSLSVLLERQGLSALPAKFLAIATLFSAGMFLVSASVTTTLMLLGAATSFALGAWASLERYARTGGDLADVAGPLLVLLPLVILFIRMPPVAFSLVVGRFPEALEYVLYAPPALWAVIGVVFLVVSVFRNRAASWPAKAYAP